MKSFKSFIPENSFYQLQTDKDAFIANDKLVMNAFFFSFIGFLAFLDGAKDKQKIRTYFMNDKKLQLANITDENNDASLIIKIMHEKGFFKTATTANEITRFLVKAKTGQITDIDATIVRGWIEGIKSDKLKLSSAVVKKNTEAFLAGGSLASFGEVLRANAKVTRWKTTEFATTTKAVKIDPAKKKAAPAAPAPASTTATSPAAAPLKKPSQITPKKATKEPWPGEVVMTLMIKNGQDVSNYKSNAGERAELLKNVLSPNETTETQKKVLAWLKSQGAINQKAVREYLIGSGNGYRRNNAPATRILQAVETGLWDIWVGFGLDSDAIQSQYNRAFLSIKKDVHTISDADAAIKKYSSLLKRVDFARGGGDSIVTNYMLALGDRDKFLEKMLVLNSLEFTRKDNKVYYHSEDDGISQRNAEILKRFQIPMGDKMDLFFRRTSSFAFKRNIVLKIMKFSAADKKKYIEKMEALAKDPAGFESWLGNMASLSSLANATNTDKNVSDILSAILDKMSDKQLLKYSAQYIAAVPMLPKNILEHLLNAALNAASDAGQISSTAVKIIKSPKMQPLSAAIKSKITDLYVNQLSPDKIRNSDYYNALHYNNVLNSWTGSDYKSMIEVMDLSAKEHDRIHAALIDLMEADIPTNTNYFWRHAPDYTYSDLNPANRKRFRAVMREGKRYPERWLNDDYLKSSSPDEISLPIILSPAVSDKQEFFDTLLKNSSKKKEEILAITVSARSPGALASDRVKTALHLLMNSPEVNNAEFSDFIDNQIQGSTKRDWAWEQSEPTGKILAAINEHGDHMGKKAQIAFEKLMRDADVNANKLQSEYQGLMPDAQRAFVKYVESSRKNAEDFYVTLGKSMKRRFAAAYLSDKDFSTSAGATLTSPNQPIKPLRQLTPKRIKEILKYNNVVSEESKLPDSKIRDFTAMDLYVRSHAAKPMEDLQIKEVPTKRNEMEQISADLHRTKRSNKHGTISFIVKRMFTVSIPKQAKEQEAWNKNHPNQEIIHPMFHGTGSIAASMILRYGWRVIKRGDAAVVGRMLGDGIYGAIHVDKAQQYLGDEGFGRRPGTVGYLFEINAALGAQGQDYRVMGLGRDHIRSPEWCVFTPNSQFKIMRAFEVEVVSESRMNDLLKKYPRSNKTLYEKYQLSGLKRFIREQNEEENNVNYTTFTFVSANLPTGRGKSVDFEEFKSPNENITFEPTSYGPSIVVKNTYETNTYLYTSPVDLEMNYPEQFEELMAYYRGEGFTTPPE